jgi:LmbE family N-acetylglucosaminyl deacetylase
VRRSRSKAATEATRALLAQVDALGAKVALAATDTRDSTRWALRYLEACRPSSVLAPAPLSPADQRKLASAQADHMVGVLRAVLEGLNLSDADYIRGSDLAIKELRAASSQGWEPL